MKGCQKEGVFGLDKLQKHTTKERKGEKERTRSHKGGEEKKAMVALLVFIMATLEMYYCWTEKVHLAVTFSKIRLDI